MNDKIVIYSDDAQEFISTESDCIYTYNVSKARKFDTIEQARSFIKSRDFVCESFTFLRVIE
jgi:hypothetical protein